MNTRISAFLGAALILASTLVLALPQATAAAINTTPQVADEAHWLGAPGMPAMPSIPCSSYIGSVLDDGTKLIWKIMYFDDCSPVYINPEEQGATTVYMPATPATSNKNYSQKYIRILKSTGVVEANTTQYGLAYPGTWRDGYAVNSATTVTNPSNHKYFTAQNVTWLDGVQAPSFSTTPAFPNFMICENTNQLNGFVSDFKDKVNDDFIINSAQYAYNDLTKTFSYRDNSTGTFELVHYITNDPYASITWHPIGYNEQIPNFNPTTQKPYFLVKGNWRKYVTTTTTNVTHAVTSADWNDHAVSYTINVEPEIYQNGTSYTGDDMCMYSGFGIDYSTAYEGVMTFTDDFVPPEVRAPEFSGSVNNKTIKATYNDPENAPAGHKLYWVLTYGDIDGIEQVQTWEGYGFPDDEFSIDVPEYGQYSLEVYYADLDNEIMQDSLQYDYQRRDIIIDVDGSMFTFNTADMECDTEGVCEEVVPPMYDDCSVYFNELDIVQGIGCIVGNFGKWLVNSLKMLIVPSDGSITRIVTDFREYMQEKLGFIWTSLSLIIGTINSMITGAANPSCVLNTGSISGTQVQINLCTARTTIGATGFDLALNIFRGTVAMAFTFSVYAYLRNFFRQGDLA